MRRKNGRTDGAATTKQIRDIVDRDNETCQLTGEKLTPETATLDHLVPVSRGGDHRPENLILVSKVANQAKGQLLLEEFVDLCRAVAAWFDNGGGPQGHAYPLRNTNNYKG